MEIRVLGEPRKLPDFIVEVGDYRPGPGSPAIDAGLMDSAPAFDIDGVPRPCGGGVDIGSYEIGGCLPGMGKFLRGDCDGDGTVSGVVTDAVFFLEYNFAGGPPPPCIASCDANGDGLVIGQVGDAVYLLYFNFLGGPPPPSPYPRCGPAPLPGDAELGCERSLESCP